MAKLIISEGGRDKIYEIIDAEFTVGRSDEADVILRDESASPRHLTIRRTKAGYQLIDLETRTGTKVNGKTVNQHILSNGDTIEVGAARITYIGKGPSVAKKMPASRPAPKGVPRRAAADRAAFRTARQQTWVDRLGPVGGVALVLGVLLIAVFLFKITASSGGTSDEEQQFIIAVDHAETLLRTGTHEDFPKIRDYLKTARATAHSAADKERVGKIARALADAERKAKERQRLDEADRAYKELQRVNVRQPNNIDKIRELAEGYLAKYKGTSHEGKVRDILAALDDTVSPERREMGRLEGIVDDLFRKKEFRKAYDAIESANPRLKDLYPEEMAALERKVRVKSQRVLGPRKNEARFQLMEGRMDKAVELVRKTIIDKLVWKTIDAYLETPDSGYTNPKVAQAELDIQTILKRELAAARARAGH